jgi:predicted DNA-binding transcriptional regulator AlpA
VRWIRTKAVAAKLGLSVTGFYMLVEKHPEFPKPVKVSERHMVYEETQVEKWMSNLMTTKQEVKNEQSNGTTG